jgi:serpin B
VINAWVETQTRDKIKDIVPPGLPTPDTVLALANAVYLKAPWSSPFAERSTEDGAFTTLGGKRVDVPFMLQAETFLYGETDAARLVELPYRSGELSMVVVLPKRTDGLPALERALDAGAFGAALAALKPARVRVALPKFSFTSGFDLSEVLPGMGMPDAFDRRRADFSGITTSERLFVGPVLHKVFVDVDEHGTEAAAATVVLMKRTSVAVGDPIDFTADHPFLFAVRHRPTGCILFLGRVANPLGQP